MRSKRAWRAAAKWAAGPVACTALSSPAKAPVALNDDPASTQVRHPAVLARPSGTEHYADSSDAMLPVTSQSRPGARDLRNADPA